MPQPKKAAKKPAKPRKRSQPRGPRTRWDDDRERWEQQQDENDARYQAFVIYRDQLLNGRPRRSLAAVGQASGKHVTLVERWSTEDSWRDRVNRYDRHVQAVKDAAQQQQLEKVAAQQAQVAAAGMAAISISVQTYLELVTVARAAVGPKGPYWKHDGFAERELAAIRALRAMPRVGGFERLVHGLSTAHVDLHATVSVEDARRQAQQMTSAEQEAWLLSENIIDGDEVAA